MKQHKILVSLTIFLLVVASVLILFLHYEGSQAVLSEFQKDQLSYAKHLSNQIGFYLQARSRGLKALASFASFQTGDTKQQKLDIQTYAKQLEQVYVNSVSVYDAKGRFVYSTVPHAFDDVENWENIFLWAKEAKNRGRTFLTPAFHGPESLVFTLSAPIFQDSGRSQGRTRGQLLGVLMFALDMKGFLANQIGFEDPPMNLDQIWIVDKNGTLLFQPDHPEMVSRNIYQSEGNCQQCHPSFHYVEEILEKKAGTLDYQIKGHPQKIAAFSPIEFENASWVVVVNTPYSRVTGFIKKSLLNHLVLVGIIVIAFAAGSMLVIRNVRVKTKAEEEVLRWQEKMEERKRTEEILQQERNKLQAILDSMKDGVYVIGQNYELLYANPALEKELGPFKGHNCYYYLFDQPGVCAECNNMKVFAGETIQWEGQSLKTGKIYDIFDTPFVGPEGTLCKLGIRRDITERKKVDEALIDSEKQLRSLSNQLMKAQETERKRIARELHDELGQSLLVMKLRLSFIEDNLLSHQTNLKGECEDGIQYIDQVIENIRRLSRYLSPAILDDFGLSAALRWMINNFAKHYNMQVMMDMADIDSLLPPHFHVVIYRTVQEALTNIGKHSQAKNVSFSVSRNTDSISFFIVDDGIGFDEGLINAKGPDARGSGLETMKGRCQILGGALKIWSREGEGTCITLSVPVKGGTMQ